jgi:hypothetical protein
MLGLARLEGVVFFEGWQVDDNITKKEKAEALKASARKHSVYRTDQASVRTFQKKLAEKISALSLSS